jgi:hypothetical protein
MDDANLSILRHLRTTPGVLRLICAVTEEEASWKPSPKRWSVLEVLGHLSHVEVAGFRGRTERMLKEDNPSLPPYDPDAFAAAGAYGGRTLAQALDEFERERKISLRLLENLPPGAASRGGLHGELGPVTLRHLLNEWPLHDLGHLRQIAELIRAVKYHPHIGPWQRVYSMNP